MEKLTKGATTKVAKAAGCAKNHEAPMKLKNDNAEEGSQGELRKVDTAAKKAVETAKRAQAREEK